MPLRSACRSACHRAARPAAGLLALALLAPAAGPATAAPALGPARYFACQIAAREATLAGMRERADLLARQAPEAELIAAGERSRARVDGAYARCGYSGTALAAYAQQVPAALQAWLPAHPQVQARYEALNAQIMALSASMQASLRGGSR